MNGQELPSPQICLIPGGKNGTLTSSAVQFIPTV